MSPKLKKVSSKDEEDSIFELSLAAGACLTPLLVYIEETSILLM